MSGEKELEARGGIEPPIMVLQTIALPLGDRATEPKETWNGEGAEEKAAPAVQFPAGAKTSAAVLSELRRPTPADRREFH